MRPYAICFDNRKATYGEKYVSMVVDIDVNWENPSESEKKVLDYLRNRAFSGMQIPPMKREYIEGWRAIDVSETSSLFTHFFFARTPCKCHLVQVFLCIITCDRNVDIKTLFNCNLSVQNPVLTMCVYYIISYIFF
ncbi:unnamed protein product [Echinostoma caproni]|uniref:DUF1015 domain-containing protein n=1 Tax=Echinostoma caproni TaxID=27848 RepID=A0A183AZV4_9TREM|nr:unnamed protein product [Echinostoma caproni]